MSVTRTWYKSALSSVVQWNNNVGSRMNKYIEVDFYINITEE